LALFRNSPEDVAVLALTSAKDDVDQLRYWIERANQDARQHILMKTEKVDELRHCLDISVLPWAVEKAGLLTLDEDIQWQQWNYLWALADEWVIATAVGRQFLLCEPSGEPPFCLLIIFRLLNQLPLEKNTAARSVPECLQQDIESLLEHLGRSNILTGISSTQTQFGPGSSQAFTDICNKTICAWLSAAEYGDPAAMQSLRDLHA
jgi:hypothetical protein